MSQIGIRWTWIAFSLFSLVLLLNVQILIRAYKVPISACNEDGIINSIMENNGDIEIEGIIVVDSPQKGLVEASACKKNHSISISFDSLSSPHAKDVEREIYNFNYLKNEDDNFNLGYSYVYFIAHGKIFDNTQQFSESQLYEPGRKYYHLSIMDIDKYIGTPNFEQR